MWLKEIRFLPHGSQWLKCLNIYILGVCGLEVSRVWRPPGLGKRLKGGKPDEDQISAFDIGDGHGDVQWYRVCPDEGIQSTVHTVNYSTRVRSGPLRIGIGWSLYYRKSKQNYPSEGDCSGKCHIGSSK